MLDRIHRYVCSASAFHFSTWASMVGCLLLFMFTAQLSAQVSADNPSVDFGSLAIGSSATPQSLNITIPSGVTLGSISVAAQGMVANPDFTLATSASSCAAGMTGTSCVVSVAFQPTAVGRRLGAVVLVDQSTPPITLNVPLAGYGTGPIVAFGPGSISTFAGIYNAGVGGFGGDNGPATSARLNYPHHVAFDGAGNLYITDEDNDLIRMVTPGGTITTFAGIGTGLIPPCTGQTDALGDGCQATSAGLLNPTGVAVDGAGNVYIADYSNNLVRRVVPGGIITIVAGTYTLDPTSGKPVGGYDGDNGPATSAHLNGPSELAFDKAGNLYIADAGNSVIREVTLDGNITSVLGTYGTDSSGHKTGVLGIAEDLVFDGSGNLYIADSGSNVIWKLNGGVLTVVAGNGGAGYSGDGGPATGASLLQPQGIRVDGSGNLYIADSSNSVIRKVTGGVIATIVGNHGAGPGYGGDGGTATSAQLNNPTHLELDGVGNLYIADTADNVIRKVDVSDAPALSFFGTPVVGVTPSQDVTVLNLGTDPLTISQVVVSPNFSLGGSDTSCSSSGQTLAPATSCILGIEFNPTTTATVQGSVVLADNTLNNASATQTIALQGSGSQSTQTITFPNPGTQTFGTPATLNATASSGLTVAYTVTSGPATVKGNTVTFTGAGNVSIEADQAGNASYAAGAAVIVTFTVNAESQSITFPNPGPQTFGVAPITLQASATSGLPVSYTVTSGPATVSTNLLTITGVGSVTVQATQPGGTNYLAASPVNMTVAVLPTPDYTVAASSAAVSMVAGSISTVTLNLTSTNYAGTVSFAVNASGSAVTASAPSVTLANGGSGSTTLTITATTSAANRVPVTPWKSGGAVMLGAVLLGAPFTLRRRRAMAVLVTAFAISLVGLMVACGSGSSAATPPPTKAARQYTLTVTPTGTGAVVNTVPFSIAVSVQ